jgi:acyl dehydratase
MASRYLEDWTVGERFETPPYTLTRERALAFANEYDPQPFHLDDAAAAASIFGRLSASGWQTVSITMRLIIDLGMFSGPGVGLGVDNLRWLRPVYPGDSLRVVSECTEVRATLEKPNGVVTFRNEAYNQNDVKVLSYVAIMLVNKRPTPSP